MSLQTLGREVSELGFDALRAHVDGLAEEVLWKVVREMQLIVAEDVQSARSLLLEHPTLAMAVRCCPLEMRPCACSPCSFLQTVLDCGILTCGPHRLP